MLEGEIPIDYQFDTLDHCYPIHLAARFGNTSTLAILLEKGADIDS